MVRAGFALICVADVLSALGYRVIVSQNSSAVDGGLCRAGIAKGNVCCDASCGSCGGKGCSKFPGGAAKCCPGTIQSAARRCQDGSDVGCLLAEAHSSGLKDWCEEGILNQGVCCKKECGQCGGSGCSDAPGGGSQCCTGQLKATKKVCMSMNDVGCVVPPNTRPVECAANAMCAKIGLPGNCCPEKEGGNTLTCCHQVRDGKTEEGAEWCHKGIRSATDGDAQKVCCDLSCGRCGGSGCGGLPGGAARCCIGTIRKKGACKTLDDVACAIPDTKPPECSAHPGCANIGLQGLCCPHESGNHLGCCEKA